MTLLYLLPLLATIGLLATRRVGPLWAGAVGLAGTLALAPLALPADAAVARVLGGQVLAGAWLAWHAIVVIVAGLLFHAVMARAEPWLVTTESREDATFDPRRLFAACFLLGPFFEAATGFGVGLVIVIPFLLRLGVRGPLAVAFGLYSQILVPWGAMAIGSTVGAGLAEIGPRELGVASALLIAPLLLGHLAIFWALQARFLRRPGPGRMLDDLAWLAALLGLLWLANRFVALEAGALVACGALLLVRLPRDAGGFAGAGGPAVRAAAPYLALTLLVLATRAVPALRAELGGLFAIQPSPELPAFAPLHHVGMLILAVALATGAAHRLSAGAWRAAVGEALRKAWTPVAVTLLFVAMGRVTAASGMAAAMMADVAALAGGAAVLATPPTAALAGFLTGSNVAANAILMPLQTGLAQQAGQSVVWAAAIQNVAGSTFTLVSPIRVAMGTALLGLAGREGEVYRLVAPLAGLALALLLLEAAGVWLA